MLIVFLCIIGIILNLVYERHRHNRKIFGTERDIFRYNSAAQENARKTNEIIEKHRAEYIKRTGHDW